MNTVGYKIKIGKFYLEDITGDNIQGFAIKTGREGRLYEWLQVGSLIKILKGMNIDYVVYEVRQSETRVNI